MIERFDVGGLYAVSTKCGLFGKQLMVSDDSYSKKELEKASYIDFHIGSTSVQIAESNIDYENSCAVPPRASRHQWYEMIFMDEGIDRVRVCFAGFEYLDDGKLCESFVTNGGKEFVVPVSNWEEDADELLAYDKDNLDVGFLVKFSKINPIEPIVGKAYPVYEPSVQSRVLKLHRFFRDKVIVLAKTDDRVLITDLRFTRVISKIEFTYVVLPTVLDAEQPLLLGKSYDVYKTSLKKLYGTGRFMGYDFSPKGLSACACFKDASARRDEFVLDVEQIDFSCTKEIAPNMLLKCVECKDLEHEKGSKFCRICGRTLLEVPDNAR